MKKYLKPARLYEATFGQDEIDYMLRSEASAKNMLIRFLKDDGRGHRHAKFAERFKAFSFKFVSERYAQQRTGGSAMAWIEFESRTVFIRKDFLNPIPEELGGTRRVYDQLSVILRHELIHSLLCHQIRMMTKYKQTHGDEMADAMSKDASLQELDNVLMDWEISDRGYDRNDANIIKRLLLNGEEISCLVVAIDHPDWVRMSLEEMYDELIKHINELNTSLNNILKAAVTTDKGLSPAEADALKYQINHLPDGELDPRIMRAKMRYAVNKHTPSSLMLPVYEFIKTNFFKRLKEGFPNLAKIILKISDSYKKEIDRVGDKKAVDKQIHDKYYDAAVDAIINSSVAEAVEITDPITGEIIGKINSPEEKKLMVDVLKECAGLTVWLDPYEQWFKYMDEFKREDLYSIDDLQKALDALQ